MRYLVLSSLFLLTTSPQSFASLTIDFAALETVQTASFSHAGVTVTGSADVRVTEYHGVTIWGGDNDDYVVDSNETITFTFQGSSALAISYHIGASTDSNLDGKFGSRTLEVFDTEGTWLGTTQQDGAGEFQVSSIFEDAPISSFSLTSPGHDAFVLDRLTFTSTASDPVIPEPASVITWTGLGIVGCIGMRWNRRRKAV
ncbi:MAG: hypothetical protein GY768_11340 [Planctomycetaceae bacterium]|nr:hypothetical protein [Planctomycetaceae bacterium]